MPNFVSRLIDNILLKSKFVDFTIKIAESNPTPDKILGQQIYIVGGKGYKKWAYLRCPCGCNDIVTLSLMEKHRPNWRLKIDRLNRPTIYPSIWKTDGCRSHFWITKGKLEWAWSDDN